MFDPPLPPHCSRCLSCLIFSPHCTIPHAKDAPRLSLPLDLSKPTTEWLGRYSLEALRLTIFDVLAPTAVEHMAQYVPILRKKVFSKVRAALSPQLSSLKLFSLGFLSASSIPLLLPRCMRARSLTTK